jgi:hypothetical protein
LQTVSASSARVSAKAEFALRAAAEPTSHAHSFAVVSVIVSTPFVFLFNRPEAAFNATSELPSMTR